jgi:hypothetical protein
MVPEYTPSTSRVRSVAGAKKRSRLYTLEELFAGP